MLAKTATRRAAPHENIASRLIKRRNTNPDLNEQLDSVYRSCDRFGNAGTDAAH